MMRLLGLRLLWTSLLSFFLALSAWAEVPVPDLSQRVTDLTGTLGASAIQQLDGKLADLETRKGSQIAVLMIPTLDGEDIASFGIRVADKWKIGRKGADDGLILIIAKNDHKLRIEVGYGLEGAIPDAIAKRVIAETITPHFKQGDFEGGINAGVDQLIGLINGEPLPPPAARSGQNSGDLSNVFIMCLVGGMFAATFLSAIVGRFTGNVLGAGGAGLAAWALTSTLGLAVFVGVLILLIRGGLGGGGGWTSGGGFGGGFGGGGWSGGGGGFGGGGASGSW